MNQMLPHTTSPHWYLEDKWLRLLEKWMAFEPIQHHPAGLERLRHDLLHRLQALNFEVTVFESAGVQPVIIAQRPPLAGNHWLGMFGHYDVETAGEGWEMPPFTPLRQNGRIFGRGLADNLGPLLLRLLTLEGFTQTPGLVWVLQGEEEIGSPWAHRLYPTLSLPPISIWLEETGYFEGDGTQRLLLRHSKPRVDAMVAGLERLAANEGRQLNRHDRYLNKAFGQDRCPCLTWLVGEIPYLAIGPNDTQSRIHAPQESLPLDTLDLSARQFRQVLEAVTTWV